MGMMHLVMIGIVKLLKEIIISSWAVITIDQTL